MSFMSLVSRAVDLTSGHLSAQTVAGVTLFSVFTYGIYSLVRTPNNAGLRVFKVTGNNVVEVLEEAHREVCHAATLSYIVFPIC